MNILYIMNEYSPMNGCIYVRNILPARRLQDMGHGIKFVLGNKQVPQSEIDWCDIAVFSRHYDTGVMDAIMALKDKKKKTVYETDDDLETLLKSNPQKVLENQLKTNLVSIKDLCDNVDLVTVTTDYLKDTLKSRHHCNVAVIPNHIDFDFYKPRRHDSKELRIGWSGGGTHATDLFYFVDVIAKLQRKYDFPFYIQGLTSMPLTGYIEMWRLAVSSGLWDMSTLHTDIPIYIQLLEKMQKMNMNFIHVPYYPITMFPGIMADVDLDIGVCPLVDTVFSRSKSCNKFYEYVAMDTLAIASDVLPYSLEPIIKAKNTPDLQDWYDILEKFIRDKRARKAALEVERAWVYEHRNAKNYGKLWEDAFLAIFKI